MWRRTATTYWFDQQPDGSFVPRFGTTQSLSLVTVGEGYEYDWADENGDVTRLSLWVMAIFASSPGSGGDKAVASYVSDSGDLVLSSIVIESSGDTTDGEEYSYTYADGLSKIQLSQFTSSNT